MIGAQGGQQLPGLEIPYAGGIEPGAGEKQVIRRKCQAKHGASLSAQAERGSLPVEIPNAKRSIAAGRSQEAGIR